MSHGTRHRANASRRASRLGVMGACIVLGWPCSSGCSSTSVRGGTAQPAGSTGVVLARFVPTDCRDASGSIWERRSEVRLVRTPDGGTTLVEAIAGHDDLVVDNHFRDGQEDVYQAALEHVSGRTALHDYRLSTVKGAPGRMALSNRWREEQTERGFRAVVVGPALACALTPVPEATLAPGEKDRDTTPQ